MALDSRQASERFYQLVWPWRADVLRTARFMTGNSPDADDLAQDALLKAYAGIHSFREGTSAKAWLMRIVRNSWIDRIRSSARETNNVSLDQAAFDVAAETEEVDDGTGAWRDPQEILEAFSDQQVIEALQMLPEEIRFTLLLVDVQQIDQAEAAEILDVPVGTIKSRAFRGRAMLRQSLLPKARETRMAK